MSRQQQDSVFHTLKIGFVIGAALGLAYVIAWYFLVLPPMLQEGVRYLSFETWWSMIRAVLPA